MCLITKDVKPRVADKDITCYKNLEWQEAIQRWETPYTYFPVDEDVIKGKEPLVAVGRKTHRKVMLIDIFNAVTIEKNVELYKCEGGWIHAYSTRQKAKSIASMFGDTTYRVIIPKGTKYYVDCSGGEMCAERIVIKKKV
jgi:hypothetical protein